tara:strand:+ start:388 stop:504 length:117 start_codon:yes stop_codon:yes gene_type:complete
MQKVEAGEMAEDEADAFRQELGAALQAELRTTSNECSL